MPGNRDYTFDDHLEEAVQTLSATEDHVTQMVSLLEDGYTDYDRRVKDLAGLIRVAEREMSAIAKMAQKAKKPF